MAFVTYLDFKNKILKELDLEEDSLVKSSEFEAYTYDAVKDMVSEMMTLGHEDRYYTSFYETNIVSGTDKYALPADCYAQKIYSVMLVKDQNAYTLKRMRGMYDYQKVISTNAYANNSVTTNYKYIFINVSAAVGTKMQLVPAPLESLTLGLKMFYFREPARASLDTDLIDVPEEFIKYVETYVKVECLKKDVGNPSIQYHMAELARLRELFVTTLTGQTLDQDTVLEQDLSFYGDCT